jgi:polar amino acid transport system substrate-binding protein
VPQKPRVRLATPRPATALLLVLVLASATAGVATARSTVADGQTNQDEQPLRVVTREIEPFVVKEGDRLTGFSIDLWKEIALLIDQPFEFIEVDSVGEQLAAVENGEADVGIAAISITAEREEVLDFSHAYYRSGLQVMTIAGGRTRVITVLANLLTSRVLPVIGIMPFLS